MNEMTKSKTFKVVAATIGAVLVVILVCRRGISRISKGPLFL